MSKPQKKTPQGMKEINVYKSPSFSRYIPEYLKKQNPFYVKVILVSFISGFLLMAISMKGYQFVQVTEALQSAQSQRSELEAERKYWLDVSEKYSGYRDAYFKVALVSYQLGDVDLAKKYLIEAMALDPNFKEGREFGQKTGLL